MLIWTAFVVLAAAALLLVAAWAGAGRKLRPNPFFGIRTTLALGDDEAWYAVHRKAAPWLAVSGVAMAVGGVAILMVEDGLAQALLLLAASAVCVTTVVAGGVTGSRAVRAERARRGSAPEGGPSERGGE